MGRRGMHVRFWLESRKERDHLEDLNVVGMVILQFILERKDEMVWTGLIWLRIGTSGGFF
jgi:hypothetical protein